MLDLKLISQYVPGESWLHRLDPRTKVLSVVAFSILVFLPRGLGLALAIAFAAVAVWAGRVRPHLLWRGLRPLLILVGITLVLNLFLTPGEPIWQWHSLTITREGVHLAVLVGLRLVLLVAFGSLLTQTTSPIALTDGLERLFRPFQRVGMPAAEVALMMTIALRFIPTLLDEAERILKAQQARCAPLGRGNLVARARAMVPVLVPLFVASFRRADELAVAMEARGYRGGRRTRMRELRFHAGDVVAAVAVATLAAGIVSLRILGY